MIGAPRPQHDTLWRTLPWHLPIRLRLALAARVTAWIETLRSRWQALLGCGVVGWLAARTAGWLRAGSPDARRIPAWFYPPGDRHALDVIVVACSAMAFPWLVRKALRAHAGGRSAAPWTVAASVVLQLVTGLVAKHGVRGWTERFFHGHGEFTYRAHRIVNALDALRRYESLAGSGALGEFARSKPPGTYAVYLLIDRLARVPWVRWALAPVAWLVAADRGIARADRTLCALTLVALGLCTALTAVPLGIAARRLLSTAPPPALALAGLLFVTLPAENVITVHLDGTVFTLLSASAVALAVDAAARHGRWAALEASLAGVVSVLAVYCSYGLLPVPVVAVAMILARTWDGSFPARRDRWIEIARHAGAFGGGLAVALAGLVLGLRWEPLAGYHRALAHHAAWRHDTPAVWRHGAALYEFALFAGAPFVAAFGVAFVSSFASLLASPWRSRSAVSGPRVAPHMLVVSTGVLLVYLSLAHGTPEAARLWQFVLPWMALGVAGLLARKKFEPVAIALVGAQVLLTLLVRDYQAW